MQSKNDSPSGQTINAASANHQTSKLKRLQLAKEASANLDSEIEMLRKTMADFRRAVYSKGRESYPEDLSKSLDLLGLTCSRLSNLMRVNIILHLNDQSSWVRQFNTQMQELLQEWESQEADNHG